MAPAILTRFTETLDSDVVPKRPPPRVSMSRLGSVSDVNPGPVGK